MNNYQQQYKKKAVGFADSNNGRLVRVVKHEELRKANRAKSFAQHRVVPEVHEVEEPKPRITNIATKLERWRIERDMKRKIEMRTKKPVFKVGIVHHKFYSPIGGDKKEKNAERCHTKGAAKANAIPVTKRITRATQKRLEAKCAGAAVTPVAPRQVKKRAPKKVLVPTTKETSLSFAPERSSFKPPAGLQEIPLFGRFAIPTITANDYDKSTREIELDWKKELEKKWPSPNVSHAAKITDSKLQSKKRSTLTRQNAIQIFNNSGTSSQENLSIETATLRLSSESENTENKINLPEVKNIKSDLQTTTEDFELTKDAKKSISAIDEKEVLKATTKANQSNVDSTSIAKSTKGEAKTPSSSDNSFPAALSPYVVSSRGKSNARKEQQVNMGIRRSAVDDIPTKDTVMQNLNISIEEEERTAKYFKFILQREVNRLTEMCKKWESIANEPDLTEDAQCQIKQAVGQTNLLITKKFERYRRLVLDCETGKGEALVRCKDLQGFWDMTYMEVKDCDARFLKLDELKSQGWVEKEVVIPSNKVKKKKTAAVKPKFNAKSSARSWILAARQKKMSQAEEEDTAQDIVIAVKDTDSKASNSTPAKSSIIENNRRSSRLSQSDSHSQRQSPPKATPKKTPTSMLKKVQLSQASRNILSPLAIMKISKMCKTPDVRLDDSISYVNSDQTPGKGILKKSEESSSNESCLSKSMRKVDFNDDVFSEEVEIENEKSEEMQNSTDRGRALARIDSQSDEYYAKDTACNFSQNVTLRRLEKRLDFEDDSFDEVEKEDIVRETADAVPRSLAIPTINIVSETPTQTEKKIQKTPAKPSRRSSRRASKNHEESIDEESPAEISFVKVLRNRTVIAVTPNKNNRRSRRSMMSTTLDTLLDSSTKENNDPHGGWKNEVNTEVRDGNEGFSKLEMNRRHSTRSFRANEDSAARTPKPARVRLSKNVSLLGDSTRVSVVPHNGGDLICFNSPAKQRGRRSSLK